jgi:hypothetical protein
MMLVTAWSYATGSDNLLDLMLIAVGVVLLPAWLIWTGRIGGKSAHPRTHCDTCQRTPKEDIWKLRRYSSTARHSWTKTVLHDAGFPPRWKRYTIGSTDGPLDSAKMKCPRGHWFNGPIESLTVPEQPAVAAVSAGLLPPLTMRGRGTQAVGPGQGRKP